MGKRLKLDTPQNVRKALTRIANMVLNGELDAKAANAIVLACNAVLSSIRIDEQQKKIEELEKHVNKNGDSVFVHEWKAALIEIANKRKQMNESG